MFKILIVQACYQYLGDSVSNEDTKNITSTLNTNESNRNNQTNCRKFRAVVTEMEALLGEFKCLMDGCLDLKPSIEEDNKVQNSNVSPDEHNVNSETIKDNTSSAAKKDTAEIVSLSPELSRAYEKSLDTRWKMKEESSINPLYQQYFSFNNEEEEKR